MCCDTIRRDHAVHPIAAVQLEWSLWTRDVEEEIIPVCRQLGIGIVAYSPLGRGVLTGVIKSRSDIKEGDWRLTNPRFQEESLAKNVELVEKLEKMAKRKGQELHPRESGSSLGDGTRGRCDSYSGYFKNCEF